MKIDVSIIIVSWNTIKLLRNCIQSIIDEASAYTYEIIVIDNDSPDSSAHMVRTEFPKVKLIANSFNNGFAPANNQGLEIAEGRNILFLNPDTIVLNGAIDSMVKYLDENATKKVGAVTCKLLNSDGTLQKSVNNFFSLWSSFIENRFFNEIFKNISTKKRFMSFWEHNEERTIDWAYGAVILISREVFEKVGKLDERFFIYAEEMDYFFRIKNAGYKSVFLPNVEIVHYGKSSSRQRRAAMFIQNYKSFYLFLKKHYSGFTYYAYRTRATLCLFIWLMRYKLSYFIHEQFSHSTEEDQNQLEVYSKTLKWHFTSDALIKI